MTDRLSAAHFSGRRPLRIGGVHLGLGAFHRAHQSALLAAADDADDWGLCGVSQRSDAVVRQLRPQDCLYAVLIPRNTGAQVRVVGQIREVLQAGPDGAAITARIAHPDTRLVTLTVTEKGYRCVGDQLDLHDPAVAADLRQAAIRPGRPGRGSLEPRTAIGQLVAGLTARAAADAPSLTIVSCDNLPDNGRVLAGLIQQFCRQVGAAADPAMQYLQERVSVPGSVVDRIVPATTDADRRVAADILGCRDEALVVSEDFCEWVIQGTGTDVLPTWSAGQVTIAADVLPYQRRKLRMLNGSHSMLAYLGLARGHHTIAQSVADDALAEGARRLMIEEAAPTLGSTFTPEALTGYAEQTLRRFGSSQLRHTTAQVAMDGSGKLPGRLLETIAARIAAGVQAPYATRAVAGWMLHVRRATRGDPLEDPLADRLLAAAAGADRPTDLVQALLGVDQVFGDELPSQQGWVTAVTDAVSDLWSDRPNITRNG